MKMRSYNFCHTNTKNPGNNLGIFCLITGRPKLNGYGEQGVALVLQVEEVAVGSIHTTWRETTGGVGGDIEPTGSGGKNLTVYKEQVTECAVRSVRATRRPGAAAIGRHLNGVVAWVDAEKFSLGEEASACFDNLGHSIMLSF